MIADKTFAGAVFQQSDLKVDMAFQRGVLLYFQHIGSNSKRLIGKESKILIQILHGATLLINNNLIADCYSKYNINCSQFNYGFTLAGM